MIRTTLLAALLACSTLGFATSAGAQSTPAPAMQPTTSMPDTGASDTMAKPTPKPKKVAARHHRSHVVRHTKGGGLPKPVARIIKRQPLEVNPNKQSEQDHGPMTQVEKGPKKRRLPASM